MPCSIRKPLSDGSAYGFFDGGLLIGFLISIQPSLYPINLIPDCADSALIRLHLNKVWFTTDNGPEVNCKPEGRCGSGTTGKIPPGTLHRPQCHGAGSAGPLRGRKRDVWEGGHRVPGIVSWPAVVKGPARVSWSPVVTMDFLATVMEVLDVHRPEAQKNWSFDGVSIMPILRGETPAPRGIGWMYEKPFKNTETGYAFR